MDRLPLVLRTDTTPPRIQELPAGDRLPLAAHAEGVAEAIAMAQTFTAVPAEFKAWEIVVTEPHLRKMVWSIAKSKYVRAPWHPVGKAGYFLRGVPEGFLEVRGDVVLQSADFPDLAEYLGVTGPTFVLDEARAEFIRNLDSDRGVDVGRAPGSFQGDAIRNIAGTVVHNLYAVSGAASTAGNGPWRNTNVIDAGTRVQSGSSGSYINLSFDASRQVPTASENRPRHLAYRYAVTF